MTKNKLWTFIQGFLAFNLLWLLGALIVDSPALPGSIPVYANLPSIIVNGGGKHLLASLYRVAAGLGIATLIGGAIGLLMGSSKKANELLNPLLYFTYPIPKTALLPVVMILFGLGDNSKITIIVLITVFQVIVSVRDAVIGIDIELYNSVKVLGATYFDKLKHVTLPAILPELLTTLRLSVGTSLSVLFFAENYGTKWGLGYFIQDSWNRIDYNSMFGGIFILALLGFVLFMIIDILEQKVCKWKKRV